MIFGGVVSKFFIIAGRNSSTLITYSFSSQQSASRPRRPFFRNAAALILAVQPLLPTQPSSSSSPLSFSFPFFILHSSFFVLLCPEPMTPKQYKPNPFFHCNLGSFHPTNAVDTKDTIVWRVQHVGLLQPDDCKHSPDHVLVCTTLWAVSEASNCTYIFINTLRNHVAVKVHSSSEVMHLRVLTTQLSSSLCACARMCVGILFLVFGLDVNMADGALTTLRLQAVVGTISIDGWNNARYIPYFYKRLAMLYTI